MTDAASDNSGKTFWYGNGEAATNGAPELRALALRDLSELLRRQMVWALFVGRRETAATICVRFHSLPPLERVARIAASNLEAGRTPGTVLAGVMRGGNTRLGLVAVTTQKQALRVIRHHSPLFVLLETEAKPESRVRFGRILRARLADTRLVAVGERPDEQAFEFDDYWEPPLAVQELAVLLQRMQAGAEARVMQRGPIRLDLWTRTVMTPQGVHHMTPKQCALLHLLLDNHDRLVSRRDIMRTIWDTTFMEDTRTLDVHIRWLRERIEPDPSEPTYLRTVRGKGYHLCVEG